VNGACPDPSITGGATDLRFLWPILDARLTNISSDGKYMYMYMCTYIYINKYT
jgi:hypothetical protein